MEKHNYNYKNYTIFQTYLTPFPPNVPFWSPWKKQKFPDVFRRIK